MTHLDRDGGNRHMLRQSKGNPSWVTSAIDGMEFEYRLQIGPLYESIRGLFVQVGGLLVLRGAGSRTSIEAYSVFGDALKAAEDAERGLSQCEPPPRFRSRHSSLLESVAGLRAVLRSLVSRDRALLDGARVGRSLEMAYNAFKAGSAEELGLAPFDMRHACFGHEHDEIGSHELKR